VPVRRLATAWPRELGPAPVDVVDPSEVDEAAVRIGPSWDDPDADLLAFDRQVHAAEDRGTFDLVIACGRPGEALLRYQRHLPVGGVSAAFEAVLAAHRALHDTTLPLVRADLDHALDTWRWVLRLDPSAPVEVQLAALLHDVERLESEAHERIEHLAPDYQAFKDAHAARGARIAEAVVAVHFPAAVAAAVGRAIATHEVRGPGTLLADADALSFLALNSAGYLRWFGPAQTARKVGWTLARTSPRARAWIPRLRLPREVAEVVDRELPGAPTRGA
jgi:hypothetical protein